jgi:Domain of unknown function (DUF6285)
MQDRPTAIELLEAAAQFLEQQIVPATEGGKQFQTRVAANVIRIVAREIQSQEPQLRDEVHALAELLGKPEPHLSNVSELPKIAFALNEELSNRIRNGDADAGAFRKRTLDVVRKIVEDKLRVANPRFLEADLAIRGGKSI